MEATGLLDERWPVYAAGCFNCGYVISGHRPFVDKIAEITNIAHLIPLQTINTVSYNKFFKSRPGRAGF